MRSLKKEKGVRDEKDISGLDWGTDNGGVTLGTITITEGETHV